MDFFLGGHDPEPVSFAEMSGYLALHKTIGQHVDALGPDRSVVLAAISGLTDPWDREEVEAIADAF